MANRIQLRRDTQANWERVNPILEDGEPGLDITQNKIKYGDGSSTWTELAYASGGSTGSGNALVNGSYTFSLGADGNVTLPDSGIIGTGTSSYIQIPADGFDTGQPLTILNNVGNKILLVANNKNWQFTEDGATTLPIVLAGDTSIGTAFNTNPPGHTLTLKHNGGVNSGSGGELKFDYGNAKIKVVKDAGTTYTWAFNSNGDLTLPSGVKLTPGYPGYGYIANTAALAGDQVYLSSTDGLAWVGVENGTPKIGTSSGIWLFGTDGTLTTPGNVIIGTGPDLGWGNISMVDTISANNFVYANGVSILDGIGGGTASTGNTAFSGNYIYNADGNQDLIITSVLDGGPGSAHLVLPSDTNAPTQPSQLVGGAGGVQLSAGAKNWTFGAGPNSTLVVPDTDAEIITPSAGSGNKNIDLYTNGWDGGGVEVWLKHNDAVYIYTDNGAHGWTFDKTGTTTFPDSGAVTISGNLTVGNLFVTGNSTVIDTTSYTVSDNIVQFADSNPADTLDLGFVAHRTVGGTLQHTGLVRDASAGDWKLFSNVIASPGSTVDFTGAVLDDLELGTLYSTLVNTGNVTANNITANLVSALNLHITSSAPGSATGATGDKAGDIRIDSDYIYYCIADYVHDSGTYSTTLTADKNPSDPYKIEIAKSSVFGTPAWETYGNGAIAWAVTFDGGPTGYVDMAPMDIVGVYWRLDLTSTPSVFGIGTHVTITNPNPTSDPVIWKRISLNAFTETAAKFASNGVLYLPNSSYIEPSSTSINWGVQGSFNLLTNDASSSTTHKWSFGDNGKITKTYGPNAAANLTLNSGMYDLTLTTTGNLIVPSNINFANGVSILAGLGSISYSNSNVASYLTTYSGNIGGNISIGGALRIYSANSAPFNTNDALYVSGGVTTVGSMASGGNITACAFTKSTSIYSGAIQTNGGIGAWGNINIGESAYITGNINVTGITNVAAISEKFVSNASPASLANVAINFAQTAIVYVTTPSGNITANIQNFSIPSGTVSSVTVWISQGATPYVANSVQINNVMQTVKWQSSATAPAGNASKQDVISFTILNSSGTYTVLGQLATFG